MHTDYDFQAQLIGLSGLMPGFLTEWYWQSWSFMIFFFFPFFFSKWKVKSVCYFVDVIFFFLNVQQLAWFKNASDVGGSYWNQSVHFYICIKIDYSFKSLLSIDLL